MLLIAHLERTMGSGQRGRAFPIPASLRSGNQSADVRNREIEFLCQCAHRDAALAIGHAQCLGSVGATLQAIAQGAGGFALHFRHLDRGAPLGCGQRLHPGDEILVAQKHLSAQTTLPQRLCSASATSAA